MKDIKLECIFLSAGPFCVHENYLYHYQTGKMHQIYLIKYTYK